MPFVRNALTPILRMLHTSNQLSRLIITTAASTVRHFGLVYRQRMSKVSPDQMIKVPLLGLSYPLRASTQRTSVKETLRRRISTHLGGLRFDEPSFGLWLNVPFLASALSSSAAVAAGDRFPLQRQCATSCLSPLRHGFSSTTWATTRGLHLKLRHGCSSYSIRRHRSL